MGWSLSLVQLLLLSLRANAFHRDVRVTQLRRNGMVKRRFGWSDMMVSPLGIGLWAIGGPWVFDDWQAGWGEVDDGESIRMIHQAMELGINLFDTAANYGCGHSERILGQAVNSRRQDIIISTKFGFLVDERNKRVTHYDNPSLEDIPQLIRQSCRASLERLDTDYIDLYLLHVPAIPADLASFIRDTLEGLVHTGMIRYYGWSTDDVAGARIFAEGEHCLAIQYQMNILRPAQEMLAFCQSKDLISLIRGPLARGVLTGKYGYESAFANDDHRSNDWFRENWITPSLPRIRAIQDILTSQNRTLPQAALAYLWSLDETLIPIPGARTMQQVTENIRAFSAPRFAAAEIQEIQQRLSSFDSAS